MTRRKSTWEEDAEEIADWIERSARQDADALIGDGPAPFAANLTQQQTLDFFTAAMFNKDGTENLNGRAAVMQQYGPVQFAEIMRTVLDSRGGVPEISPPPSPEMAVY